MEFPGIFNAHHYRERYPDLEGLTDEELVNHYLTIGKEEGRRAGPVQNRIDFVNCIIKSSDRLYLYLEIGPFSHSKAVLDHTLPNVHSVDVMTKEEIITKYKGSEVPIDDIIEPTYIWKGEPYDQIIPHKYDYILTSHNIEHSPDLVGFLNNLASVLKKNGKIVIMAPDCRYSFDHFKPHSTIFQVLNNHYYKHTKPSLEYVLESIFCHGSPDFIQHWRGNHGENPMSKLNVEDVKRFIETEFNSTKYFDSHVWKFTPDSFSQILDVLLQMGLIKLKIHQIYPTFKEDHEFRAVLVLSDH